jgi:hypothetical protein
VKELERAGGRGRSCEVRGPGGAGWGWGPCMHCTGPAHVSLSVALFTFPARIKGLDGCHYIPRPTKPRPAYWCSRPPVHPRPILSSPRAHLLPPFPNTSSPPPCLPPAAQDLDKLERMVFELMSTGRTKDLYSVLKVDPKGPRLRGVADEPTCTGVAGHPEALTWNLQVPSRLQAPQPVLWAAQKPRPPSTATRWSPRSRGAGRRGRPGPWRPTSCPWRSGSTTPTWPT